MVLHVLPQAARVRVTLLATGDVALVRLLNDVICKCQLTFLLVIQLILLSQKAKNLASNVTKQTNKQSTHPYRIPMCLFVLCAVAAVAERLVAVVVGRELAKERLLPSVRPKNYILENDKTLLL